MTTRQVRVTHVSGGQGNPGPHCYAASPPPHGCQASRCEQLPSVVVRLPALSCVDLAGGVQQHNCVSVGAWVPSRSGRPARRMCPLAPR